MGTPTVGPAVAVHTPHTSASSAPLRSPDSPSFAQLVRSHRAATDASPGAPVQPVASSPLGEAARALLARVSHGERYVDSVVHQGLAGRAFSNGELLVMQAQVYRYTQDLDLVSKLVDKATSAVRTVLTQNG